MRNRAANILFCLLISALLTVAVAWLCALYTNVGNYTITYDPPPPGTRLSSSSSVPAGWVKGSHVVREGPGIRYELVTEMEWIGSRLGMMSDRQNRSVERVEVGWPLPAMEWIGEMDYRSARPPAAPGTKEWHWIDGIVPPVHDDNLSLGASRRLPVVPIWPGFAVNSIALAALLYLCAAMWITLRQKSRRRRGLCANCAYPIGPAEICSECGSKSSLPILKS